MDISTQIKLLFREGKLAEAQGYLKDAKNKYLDAASLALQQAQQTVDLADQQGYKSIAITLIDYSKKIQAKIDFQNLVFSSDVDELFAKQTEDATTELPNSDATIEEDASASVKAEDTSSSTSNTLNVPFTEILPIHKIIIVMQSGTPLFSLDFNSLVDTPAKDIDEFLFAGALTAISALMTEVIQQSVRTIDLAQGCLLTNHHQGLIFVVYASEDTDQLAEILQEFAVEFTEKFAAEIEEAETFGISVNENESIISLVHAKFGY